MQYSFFLSSFLPYIYIFLAFFLELFNIVDSSEVSVAGILRDGGIRTLMRNMRDRMICECCKDGVFFCIFFLVS